MENIYRFVDNFCIENKKKTDFESIFKRKKEKNESVLEHKEMPINIKIGFNFMAIFMRSETVGIQLLRLNFKIINFEFILFI